MIIQPALVNLIGDLQLCGLKGWIEKVSLMAYWQSKRTQLLDSAFTLIFVLMVRCLAGQSSLVLLPGSLLRCAEPAGSNGLRYSNLPEKRSAIRCSNVGR